MIKSHLQAKIHKMNKKMCEFYQILKKINSLFNLLLVERAKPWWMLQTISKVKRKQHYNNSFININQIKSKM